MLFGKSAEQFLDWQCCPHINRLIEEGKSITKRYAAIQRGSLLKIILPSNLSLLKLNEVKPSHIIDFRASLSKLSLASSTVNKIMNALKEIFHEFSYREDLPYNPTLDVGIVKEYRKERGVLTVDELKLLFPLDYLKIWTNEIDYTCFIIAASTGMRRGEVLA